MRSALCFLVAAALAGPLAAQPADLIEQVEVQRVNLEVFAVDAKDEPVTDLQAADFTVFEDGKQVELRNFSRIGRSGTFASNGAEDAKAQPSYVVLFLDELSPVREARQTTYAKLASSLHTSLPAGTQVMLVRYTGTPEVLQPFSSDSKVLDDAVERAGMTISSRLMEGEQERDQAIESIRWDAREGKCLFGDQVARAYAELRQRDALATAAALDWVVGSLAGLPGRKVVVYVGRGVPLKPGEEAWDTYLELCDGSGAARGVVDASDTSLYGDAKNHRPDPRRIRLESLSYDTSATWSAVAARANGLGVSIYGLAASNNGPISPASAASAGSDIVFSAVAANYLNTLALLSSESGGRVAPAERPDVGMAQLGADLASYYFLGYEPRALDAEHIRNVRVETSRPGVRLRYRRTVFLSGTERRTTDQLLTRLLHGVGENPLDIRLASVSTPAKGRSGLEVHVPLKRLTLLPGTVGQHGMFVVYLVLRDPKGGTTPVRKAAVPVQLAAPGATTPTPEDFVYRVTLPPSATARLAAVAVRDELSGETSFVSIALRKDG